MGTPSEVWHEPVNGFVYDFLGNYNEFEGWKAEDGSVHLTEYDVLEASHIPAQGEEPLRKSAWRPFQRAAQMLRGIPPGPAPLPAKPDSGAADRRIKASPGAGTPVKLYARPHELTIVRVANGRSEYISARILHINPAGPLAKIELERKNGNLLQAEVPTSVVQTEKLAKGMTVLVRPTHTRIFE
jgi:ABC-type sulfate/molybdate transport systems ATPase subunit